MLWGRAANRCAFTNCKRELVIDSTETDDESLVGEACHMIAESPQGPRGDSLLTDEQRNRYDNLILLCAVHHKVIDDQPTTYPVSKLKEIKQAHENWVKTALSLDIVRQRHEELCASYADEWSKRANLVNWKAWTSWLLSPQPVLSREMSEALQVLRDWLLSRIWPEVCPELQESLSNFFQVLNDFLLVFHEHSKEHGDDAFITEKFYKIDYYDPKLYRELGNEYDRHVDLIHDLTLELTRAANYVCDKVRNELLHSFRLSEGALLVDRGLDMDFKILTLKPEYKVNEKVIRPYPGLDEFKRARYARDFCFSER
jgi:hypothetical protein